MVILGLDLSTNSGWSILNNGQPIGYGLLSAPDVNNYELVPDYAQVDRALKISEQIRDLIQRTGFIDFIYIEQTNKGQNRISQKQLEMIHFAVLTELRNLGMAPKVRYVDTSAWRKALGIQLNKLQREHNKLVRKKLARGKITWKHLAVEWANAKYGINLLLKDDDIADALALATYGTIKSQAVTRTKNLSNIF